MIHEHSMGSCMYKDVPLALSPQPESKEWVDWWEINIVSILWQHYAIK